MQFVLLLSLFAISVHCSNYSYYATWSSTLVVDTDGISKYFGYIPIQHSDGSVQNVTVKFTPGPKGVAFVQTGVLVPGGDKTDYFKSGSAKSPYRSPSVTNDPPAASVMGLKYAATYTLEFSSPLSTLLWDFVSFNANSAIFSNDFTIVSYDDGVTWACGYWGCGSNPTRTVGTDATGALTYIFSGSGEPHGTLLFSGTFTKFVWTETKDENWNGFNIGTFGFAGDVFPAKTVYYPTWSPTTIIDNGVTKYTGLINVIRPGGVVQEVGIKFTPGSKGIDFIQSPGVGDQTDYFKSGSPNSPYISGLVANDPPASTVVGLRYAATYTLEFSVPINSIIFDFVSFNANTAVFSNDFQLLSYDDGSYHICGYWGCGYNPTELIGSSSGVTTYTFSGTGEPHGTLYFPGVFNKLVWTVTTDEDWNGFTVGTFGLAADSYPTCVVSQLSIPVPPSGVCPNPSSNCLHITPAVASANQASQTCTTVVSGCGTFTITNSGQTVYLSSDATSANSPAFDELGVLTATSPSGVVRGGNYISWQADCANPTYKNVIIPTSPITGAVDITSLFGKENGTFILCLTVINKYNPYSAADAYICTGSNLKGATISGLANDQSVSVQSVGNAATSTNMLVLVAVGASVATALVVVLVGAVFGYVFAKKGATSAALTEKFVS